MNTIEEARWAEEWEQNGHECVFRRAFDENGVLYYIATCGNTKAYACPSASGLVVPRMSSIYSDDASYGAPARFLLHKHDGATSNYTKNKPNSWMSVDLGEGRSLVVNYYSLRHGRSNGYNLLRHWVLEGSNDGSNWIVLRAHTNDDSLPAQGFSVAAWKVEGAAQACRHFRIRQTGKNSHNKSNSHNKRVCHDLCCAGIELWGRLLSR